VGLRVCRQRMAQGLEPENIDKEFLRLWFKERCDPYKDAVLPEVSHSSARPFVIVFIDDCTCGERGSLSSS
jgi:hypothetical protein